MANPAPIRVHRLSFVFVFVLAMGCASHHGKPTTGMPAGSAAAGMGEKSTGTGICPAGVAYPAPDLTGTLVRVYEAPDTGISGQFEGPVWLADRQTLLFSDMATGSPAAVVPADVKQLSTDGTVRTALPDSGSNGMAVDRQGTVYACSHKTQGIMKIDQAQGTMTLMTGAVDGKRFNSPNDLTVRSDGTIYFTDPDFQLGAGRVSQTGIKGVYRVSPAGQVTLIDGTFTLPNGIGLSPDESVLYVADNGENTIVSFSVASDGGVHGKKVFVDVESPDGVAVDCAGNLYVASYTAGTAQVFAPDGKKLGSIAVGPGLTNLAFGGPDRKTLYLTARRVLYSLALNLPGFPY